VIAGVFDDEELGPEDQRPAFLAALQQSGESAEPWTARARDIVSQRVAAVGNVHASVSCYRAGCYAEVSSESRDDVLRATGHPAQPRPSDLSLASWESGSLVTPVEVAQGGGFVASVILLRP
jgi:hypothetical protein